MAKKKLDPIAAADDTAVTPEEAMLEHLVEPPEEAMPAIDDTAEPGEVVQEVAGVPLVYPLDVIKDLRFTDEVGRIYQLDETRRGLFALRQVSA